MRYRSVRWGYIGTSDNKKQDNEERREETRGKGIIKITLLLKKKKEIELRRKST